MKLTEIKKKNLTHRLYLISGRVLGILLVSFIFWGMNKIDSSVYKTTDIVVEDIIGPSEENNFLILTEEGTYTVYEDFIPKDGIKIGKTYTIKFRVNKNSKKDLGEVTRVLEEVK